MKSASLRAAGFYDLAVAAAKAGLAAAPSDAALERQLALGYALSGDYRSYYATQRAIIAQGRPGNEDYNGAGWAALFLGAQELGVLDELGLSRRLIEGGPAGLHTLVCLLGAAGRYEEARSAYAKMMDDRASHDDVDLWLAHGFLALSFGLPERAAASFARAAGLGADRKALDSSALAALWLKRR